MQVQIKVLMEEVARLQPLADQVKQLQEAAKQPELTTSTKAVDLVRLPVAMYFLPNGEVRPAVIVHFRSEDSADLQVFTNGDADKPVIPERIIMVNTKTGADRHTVPSLVHRPGVTRGDEAGQWNWPVGG
jgi:hypothetical protein